MKAVWSAAVLLAYLGCGGSSGPPEECEGPVDYCDFCAPIDLDPGDGYRPDCREVRDWMGTLVPECIAGATEPCWVGEIDEEQCPFEEHFYIHVLNNGDGASEIPSLALCTVADCDACGF